MNKEVYIRIVEHLALLKNEEQKAMLLEKIFEPLINYNPKIKFEIAATKTHSFFVEAETILYARGRGSYTDLYYELNGVRKCYTYSKNIKKLTAEFHQAGLLNIQKGYRVNPEQVYELDSVKNEVVLKCGDTISVSRDMHDILKEILKGRTRLSLKPGKAA